MVAKEKKEEKSKALFFKFYKFLNYLSTSLKDCVGPAPLTARLTEQIS